jgi:class 3 adenylate cyclase
MRSGSSANRTPVLCALGPEEPGVILCAAPGLWSGQSVALGEDGETGSNDSVVVQVLAFCVVGLSGGTVRSADWRAVNDVPRTCYAKNGEVHLAYQVLGQGPADLLLVWGGPNHLDLLWENVHPARLLRRFTEFSRLIHLDQRGTGLSDRVPVSKLPTLEERARDIGAVMDSAGSERAVILGESDGGLSAMLFAATYPERTTGLVLWGTLARGSPDADYPWGPSPELVHGFLDAVEHSWGEPVGVELIFPSRAGDERFCSWWGRNMRAAASPAAARALMEMTVETDVRPILPAIHVPTLVMHRTGDMLFSVEGARYVARCIPDARFIEFPGQDHVFWADDDDVFAALEEFVTGQPARPRSDRVLATTLFTDIVGSTERAAAVGDRKWKHLIHGHYEFAGPLLERYDGRLVRTTGDGLLACFDGPGRAIGCAAAIRDSARSMGIEIRAGIHTGEIEVLEDDIAGIAVHIAQRVQGRAGPGEVLVSSTVKDLVAGSGLEFEDRGEHELKGVPGLWRVFAVVC